MHIVLVKYSQYTLTPLVHKELEDAGLSVGLVNGRPLPKELPEADIVVQMGLGEPQLHIEAGQPSFEEGLELLDELIVQYPEAQIILHSNHGARNAEVQAALVRQGIIFVHAQAHARDLVQKVCELAQQKTAG